MSYFKFKPHNIYHLLCIVILSISIGVALGYDISNKSWIKWGLEEGYLYHDAKSGEIKQRVPLLEYKWEDLFDEEKKRTKLLEKFT